MSFRTKIIILTFILFAVISIFLYVNTFKLDTVNNAHKNTIKQEEPVKQSSQKEKLELTQDTVDLEVGAIFDFTQYIKVAEDKYGYSVKDKIHVDGKIPTDKIGSYQVEYVLDLGNGKKITKLLKINVKRFD